MKAQVRVYEMNEYEICVLGGAGHVGLPLSIAFAHHIEKPCLSGYNGQN